MTKGLTFKTVAIAAIISALVVLGVGIYATAAQANPSSYYTPTGCSAATTTVCNYLTSTGQATSTAFDSFSGMSSNEAIDGLTLLVQDAASSTSSSLNIRFQHSPNNVDWYDDSVSQQVGNISTTSMVASLQPALSYQWPAAVTATTSKEVRVPAPMRYVRAIFTESGAAAAIWYAWAPVKQNH